MKKTYIKPENTVVLFNVEQIICESINNTSGVEGLGKGTEWSGDTEFNSNSREIISSGDAWEEW